MSFWQAMPHESRSEVKTKSDWFIEIQGFLYPIFWLQISIIFTWRRCLLSIIGPKNEFTILVSFVLTLFYVSIGIAIYLCTNFDLCLFLILHNSVDRRVANKDKK